MLLDVHEYLIVFFGAILNMISHISYHFNKALGIL